MVVLQRHVALHRHVVARVRPQQPRALVHVVVPAHDALLDHAVLVDHASAHDRAVLDHAVVAHAHALADHHIRTNGASRTDLCGRVLRVIPLSCAHQQHISLEALASGELAIVHLLLGLADKVKIERRASHEILRLANIRLLHEAVNQPLR